VWAKMAGFPHWPAQVCCFPFKRQHGTVSLLETRPSHTVVACPCCTCLLSGASVSSLLPGWYHGALTWVVRWMLTGAGAHALCTAGARARHAAPCLRGVLRDCRLPGGYPAPTDILGSAAPAALRASCRCNVHQSCVSRVGLTAWHAMNVLAHECQDLMTHTWCMGRQACCGIVCSGFLPAS
jgi:hypothetical protein